MPNGTVKFYNNKKGFGFITADDDSREIFLPTASVTASGLTTLMAGQRVSFETQPDKKGPKAVNLTLLDTPVAPKPAAPRAERKTEVVLYFNPDSDISDTALEELRAGGIEPRVIDYIATPPSAADLRTLSLLLRENDQSLVRKYDTLFLELRLDDRFISENEFWGAIAEHPTLINGPVLAAHDKASLCRSEQDVRNFIASIAAQGEAEAPQVKGLSPRLLQLMAAGENTNPRPAAPAPAPVDIEEEEKPAEKIGARTILKAIERPAETSSEAIVERVPVPEPAPVAKPEPEKAEKAAKAPAKTPTAAKPKTAVKATAKKSAAKPVTNAKRK